MTITLSHQNRCYEDQSVYVVGNAFLNCTFRRCTLILKDLSSASHFESCRFESCVWHLQVTISDRRVWEHFLDHDADVLTQALPPVDGDSTSRTGTAPLDGGSSRAIVPPGPPLS